MRKAKQLATISMMLLLCAGAAAKGAPPAKNEQPKPTAVKSEKKDTTATPPKLAPTVSIKNASKFADDTISKAMEDELLRSITELKIKGNDNPYFVSYLATDSQQFSVYGSFGALDQVNDSRYRTISSDVRVGDYKLDSSNRRGLMAIFGLRGGSGMCCIDDNYDAIRHALWLDSDYKYKRAIEGLESKKAILQQKKVEDLPDSMCRTEPVVSMKPASNLELDKERWKKTVRDISGVFRDYPAVVDSTVAMIGRVRTRWFANSEGSINREGNHGILLGISANGQAEDGMRVTDFELFAARDPDAIPTKTEIDAKARDLAKRVKALTDAKPIDDYRGPILFEKQAAAELFAQALAPRLTNKSDSVAALTAKWGPENDKIGRRILPNFISVIDDPTALDYKGQQLKGGYAVDDEGVKAQRVTLVDNGYLKTFCSGRSPSRDVKESNGHWIDGNASTSQLFIESSKEESLSKLKERLIELGKEEGLDYVVIVRHISSGVLSTITPGRSAFFMDSGREVHISEPTLLYKVYVKDGKEELVRGGNFTRLSHRLFRDIVTTGDDSAAYTVRFSGAYGTTGNSVVTPSVLVSEVDLERESHQNDMPMILKNSFFSAALPKQPKGAK
ncbi:MAG: hypothetical protein K2X93_20115 [Candidatus Obscuribacterales bacterium]|nr:hypothetical protein [Candidatus Obscuribacterales bacterium]